MASLGRRWRLRRPVEWPTLFLIAAVHGAWAATLFVGEGLHPLVVLVVLAPVLTLHSSLQHEALHGHPFVSARLNEAMVLVPLGLLIPYRRFREQHLAHHHDPSLTDPYDDPESNYLDPDQWSRLAPIGRLICRANNTLLGRMILGPLLSQYALVIGDLRTWRERDVARAWMLHLSGAAFVLFVVQQSGVSLWAYGGAVWLSLGILKIRTFAEHRAALLPRQRSVVIEDRGPLALLFLNNNFHAVHHARPSLAWHLLPAAYEAERDIVLRRNGGYRYSSYWPLIRDYFFSAKDPVAHPFLDVPPPSETASRQTAAPATVPHSPLRPHASHAPAPSAEGEA